jgi:hypothetical protein
MESPLSSLCLVKSYYDQKDPAEKQVMGLEALNTQVGLSFDLGSISTHLQWAQLSFQLDY